MEDTVYTETYIQINYVGNTETTLAAAHQRWRKPKLEIAEFDGGSISYNHQVFIAITGHSLIRLILIRSLFSVRCYISHLFDRPPAVRYRTTGEC